MITFADIGMCDELKALWKAVFGDSDTYINLYFTHRFEPKNTMVYLENGKPIGMVTMLPMIVRTPAKDLYARYVYAVATHPDYRGKGISTLIMEEVHRWCKGHDVDLSILVPAEKSLFCFYNDRGYNINFNVRTLTKTANEIEKITGEQINLHKTTLYKQQILRNRYFGRSHMYAKWDERALKYQDMEIEITNGEILGFSDDKGYVIAYKTENQVFIKEIVLFDLSLDNALLAVHKHFGASSYTIRLWEDGDKNGDIIPFAMTRWYNEERQKLLADDGGKAPYIGLVLD